MERPPRQAFNCGLPALAAGHESLPKTDGEETDASDDTVEKATIPSRNASLVVRPCQDDRNAWISRHIRDAHIMEIDEYGDADLYLETTDFKRYRLVLLNAGKRVGGIIDFETGETVFVFLP